MVKNFTYCLETSRGIELDHQPIQIETNGQVADWYGKLFSKLNALKINWDYGHGDYATRISCWDADISVYQHKDTEHIRSKGLYFQYIRPLGASKGQWYSQYPENACRCHGKYCTDVQQVCDHLKHDDHCCYQTTGFSDMLTAMLFPDHVVDVDDNIQATTMPLKKQAIQTVDDAMKFINWIDYLHLEQFIDLPDDFYKKKHRLTSRLSNARMWIENSVVKR